MILSDFVNFLLPDFADPIQIIFFIVMVALITLTISSAHFTASAGAWNKKWTGGASGKADDNLDIEHGSVMELSHAVATAPEKLADVMPGLLLIVGLLGTFLGLGLALNNASNILSQPDALNPGAAASSMQNLLDMLQGLGTKFKTSTWGIIGFILLKIWSEVTRFEEKRMTWVIRKVKQDLDTRKLETKNYEDEKLSRIVKAIAENSHKTSIVFEECMERLISSVVGLENTREQSETQRESKRLELSIQISNQINDIGSNIVSGFSALQDAIKTQNSNAEIRSNEAIGVVREGFNGASQLLNAMRYELESSSKTLKDFSLNTFSLVEGMSQASSQMAEGARGVGVAASGLVEAVETFEHKFTEVLDQIRADLGNAINEMSQQAADTLESGSNKLHAATSEISVALSQLSEDVQGTMLQVQGSVDKALKIQADSARQFIISSNTLNEKVQDSIEITKKLTTPIEFGLKAISESNREQASVYRKLDSSIKEFQDMSKSLNTFGQIITPIESISEQFNTYLVGLKEITALLTSIKSTDRYHEAINVIKSSMQNLENQSLSIHSTLQERLNPRVLVDNQSQVEVR